MDSSLRDVRSEPGKLDGAVAEDEEFSKEGAEPHIHMPNPSLWPFVLSVAILVTIVTLLFISTAPWIIPIPVILVLIGIIGWGVEDPMAHREEKYMLVRLPVEDVSKFKIGQGVVDKDGIWLGKVQARFNHHLLVERGSFLRKVYYIPHSAIKDELKNNTIALTMSEEDLQRMELDRVPEDLYDNVPEYGRPDVSGVAQFGRGQLSPAETGHYNYGRHWPGINTDASGSYPRNEVTPRPQRYVDQEV